MENVKNGLHCDGFFKEDIIDYEKVSRKLNYVHDGLSNTSVQVVLLVQQEDFAEHTLW